MLRLLLCVIFFGWQQSLAMDLLNNQECSACHFSERNHVKAKFPTGFGRWDDAQCYGCHKELTEVANNYAQGKNDERFSSLPVSDDRISRMEHEPLPYLDAAVDPIWRGNKSRTTEGNLANFLRRPHGRCSTDGTCSPPSMMAYPDLKTNALDVSDPKHIKNSELGKNIFNEKCSGCHESSDSSGYNAAAMSLFSADWIFHYANDLVEKKSNRKMPKIPITTAESDQLYAYFQISRLQKEAAVDALAKQYISNFKNKNTSLSVSNINYMWSRFWRDGDCVHCHSIGGRATEKFDTSTAGLVKWLKNNDPGVLVERLITRHAEQEVGMGAEKPGMPMTRQPLSFTAITILDTWIKLGCPDQDLKKFCERNMLLITAN